MEKPSINVVFTTTIKEKHLSRHALTLTIDDTKDTIFERLANQRQCLTEDLYIEPVKGNKLGLTQECLFALCAKVVDRQVSDTLDSQVFKSGEDKIQFTNGTANNIKALSNQFTVLVESKADLTSLEYPIPTKNGVEVFKGSILLDVLGQIFIKENKLLAESKTLLAMIGEEKLTSIEQCKSLIFKETTKKNRSKKKKQ